jgi:non-canonical poly(A) RNA polymerase PAPD5/7
MLSLRDPADETNDLGHKAIAIKHFQATVAALDRSLSRDLQINTRDSLLGPLVSPSYMLYKERRHKLSEYGKRLSNETKTKLAVNARLLREGAECDKTMEELQEYICRVKGRKVKSGSAI